MVRIPSVPPSSTKAPALRGVGTLLCLALLLYAVPTHSRIGASASAVARSALRGRSAGALLRAALQPREFAPYTPGGRPDGTSNAWEAVGTNALAPPPPAIPPHQAALMRAVEEGWVRCSADPKDKDACNRALEKASLALPAELALEAVVLGDPDALRIKAAVAAAQSAGLKQPQQLGVHAQFLSSEDKARVEGAERVLGLATLWGMGWPLPQGTRITSPYGERVHPVTGKVVRHEGVDLAAATGTALSSPAAARVVHVGQDAVSGLYVVLDHGHGVQSVSCHLSEATVNRNDDVSNAATYARSGASGRVTGPHLHYGVRVGGRFVDPVAASRRLVAAPAVVPPTVAPSTPAPKPKH